MNVINIDRVNQLSKAAKILTALTVLVGMPLCALLLSSFWAKPISNAPMITISPAPQPTKTAMLVNVEYQIEAIDLESVETISLWYTSESGGKNQIDSLRMEYTGPFTKTVTVNQGEYIEVVGIPVSQGMGKLTCRILINNVLVEQSTSTGSGAGVYCSSVAIP